MNFALAASSLGDDDKMSNVLLVRSRFDVPSVSSFHSISSSLSRHISFRGFSISVSSGAALAVGYTLFPKDREGATLHLQHRTHAGHWPVRRRGSGRARAAPKSDHVPDPDFVRARRAAPPPPALASQPNVLGATASGSTSLLDDVTHA